MNTRTKKLTTLAMMCAFAYVIMVIGRIPIVMFLKYDPKDVIVTIGGFIYGPLAAFAISAIVSLVEMFTVSDTGVIGLIMNILSTCGFACTAALIYKKKRTMSGAVIGLISGVLVMTILMILWNYLITPIYMGYPREAVANMLLPVFLPFNLLKGGLNMAITLLLYKPIVTALRKAKLLETSSEQKKVEKGKKVGLALVSLLLLATCILIILVWTGII